ncbi:MAG: adenylate/guanylate cyclase domain-containing protein, partial [Anaerolineales bacterium]|nr:adenylate/guanylate cyclase domain-containing protein [Anaerolineales bacterium]
MASIWRFGVQSVMALVIMLGVGVYDNISIPGGDYISLGWLGYPLTFLWIVGLVNAYNFMDGIDGNAGGIGAVAGIVWAMISLYLNQPYLLILSLLISVSCAGFLGHNWQPASIFMGDSGSTFLGFTFAVLPLLMLKVSGDMNIPVAATLVVAPWIWDATYTFLRRLWRREPAFTAHRTYLYQRLATSGYPHRSGALLYIALSLLTGLGAFLYIVVSGRWSLVLLLLVVFPMLLGTFQIYKKWRAGSRSAGMAMIAFLSLAPIIPLRFLLVDILIMDLVAKSLQLLMFLLLGLSVAQRINDLKKLAIEQQVRLTEAYQRFVPKQLLSNLEKESILDVQLGDQVQKEMSILFSDIRSFTTLSESMSPEENFKFVNSYLKHMGPLVREHNGYIDKFIGDAIMALFDQSPEDAVKTAVAMLETLTDYNDGRERAGYEPIRIGVGVNTGMMMLGTLGESDRMEGSVISDAVNLAARLEGLTKLYQIPLLISETTMQQLPTDSFSIRLIDRVSVKGKKDPILVYEVLNPELPKIREGKINN